jgi:hypothetical protein
MTGKIYCPMLILEKDEEITDENQFEAYVNAWLDDGDIYLEIMDEKEKSVIISMAPELLISLIQKSFRKKATENQLCPECEMHEIQTDGNIKLPTISKGKMDEDSKKMIV